MAKTLSAVAISAPSAPVTGENGDTFTFTCAPTFSGTAGVNAYDLKFLVNPAGAGFVTIATSTGLSTAATNPVTGLTVSTNTSITVTCSQPGAYTIEIQGAPASGGAFTLTSGTQTVNIIAPGAYTQDTTLVQRRAAMDHLDDPALGQPPFGSGIPMAWLQSDYDQTNARRIAPRHLDNPVVPNRVPTLPPQLPLVDYHDDSEFTQSRRRLLDEATMPEVAAAAPPKTLVQTHSDNFRLKGPRDNSEISNGPYPVTLPPAMVATQAGPSTVTITEQSVYYPTAIGLAPATTPVVTTFVDAAHSQQYTKVARLTRLLADEVRPILVPTQPAAGWIPAHSDLRARAAMRPTWDGFAAPPAVAAGEFLVTYASQWHHQWEIPRLRGPRPFDYSRSEMPWNFTSAVIPTFVSQWHHQWDVAQVRPWKIIDRAAVPATPTPSLGEFLQSFVSQWHHQHDLRPRFRRSRLAPEVPATPTPASAEFVPSYVSQWLVQEMPRRSAARLLALANQAEAPLAAQASVLAAIMTQDGYVLLARLKERADGEALPIFVAPRLVTVLPEIETQIARRRPRVVFVDDATIAEPEGGAPLLSQWEVHSEISRLAGKLRLSDSEASVLSVLVRHYVRHVLVGAPTPVRGVAGEGRVTTVKGSGADRTVDGSERR